MIWVFILLSESIVKHTVITVSIILELSVERGAMSSVALHHKKELLNLNGSVSIG